jgi:hypothetical protein
LAWAPPTLTSPTVVNLDASTPYLGYFADDEDVLVVLPGTLRTAGVNIDGGRHVQVIGGEMYNAKLLFVDQVGSVFVEGVAQDFDGHDDDAIHVASDEHRPDVYIQNCRITGVTGTFAGVHGDCIQLYGDFGTVGIDTVTMTSNYQGVFAPNADGYTSDVVHISRCDMTSLGDGAVMLTPALDGLGTPSPWTLTEVYIDPYPGDSLSGSVNPGPGHQYPYGAVESGSTLIGWPFANGTAALGVPAGGEWVPDGTAGLSYVSPGYS